MPIYRLCNNSSSWLPGSYREDPGSSRDDNNGIYGRKIVHETVFSVFIRRMIYNCSRLCYRPLSLTGIFLLHDTKKRTPFYVHNMASLESSYMILRF